MGAKEILNRLKKMESGIHEDNMVTLIVLEDGKEKRKCMSSMEATSLVLKQDTAYLFGSGERQQNRVIGVESGDDDGFIAAILSCDVNPENAEKFIQTEPDEDGDHEQIYSQRPKRPELQPEPVKESVKPQTIGNEMQQLIRRQKEERHRKDKERADKANAVNRIVT